ncbi:hypothetical protein FA13DRAFT_1739887 [Coprinellus micaceus]|uniref:Uncharacterized protein n=1 Tax=Coprinellus micaceus TaxID=71717 RepID=A0A4Y7SQS0_COPMI|nr:hypothetical protein FA13DRAFT_1739887 [Coprinellus micaceus]
MDNLGDWQKTHHIRPKPTAAQTPSVYEYPTYNLERGRGGHGDGKAVDSSSSTKIGNGALGHTRLG